MLEHFSLPAEKKEEGSEFMKRQIVLCLFLFFSLYAGAQNIEVELECRVLTPEEYGGNGYIVSHKDLIDGAFVEVTNLSNLKKSTAVVRRHTAVDREGVISGVLAVNLDVPFNGTAALSVRYISFLNNSEDVFAPFYTESEIDREQMEAVIAEKEQEQQNDSPASADVPVEERPLLSATVDEAVAAEPSLTPSTQLPVPEWREPAEERLVLSGDHGITEPVPPSEWHKESLPDPSLFEMNFIEDRLVKEDAVASRRAPLPEVEIERPGYIFDRTEASSDAEYTRTVDEIPVWRRELTAESHMPRPRNVTVSVNGQEIGLTHYPEIESDCYRIVDDKTQVKRINDLFRLAQMRLPETVSGTGVEDPIAREETYTPAAVAEPQVIQMNIREPERAPEPEPEPAVEEPAPEPEPEPAAAEPAPEPEPAAEEPKPIIIDEPDRPDSPLISGALYIQTGAFQTEAAAERQASKLRELFPTLVFRTESDGKTTYKVAVGPVTPDEIGVIRLYLKSFRITDAFPIIGR